MTMPYILRQGGQIVREDFISFPQDMQLAPILHLLWPLSGMPNCDKREAQLQLRYRTNKKKQEMVEEAAKYAQLTPGGIKMVKPTQGDKDETSPNLHNEGG